MAQADDQVQIIQEVIRVLADLQIPYAIGGSLASSMLGKPRLTLDADIAVEPFPGKESALVGCFGPNYYVSEHAVREAVQRRSSFNILHTLTGFKVDVFVRKDRPFEQSMMARRRAVKIAENIDPVDVVSPEDIVLLKLEWYRLGGETSDRQWRDVLGVLQAQAGQINEAYLDQWAADLKVSDLLERARQEIASKL